MATADDVLSALGRLPQIKGDGGAAMDLSQLTQIANNGTLLIQVLSRLTETLQSVFPLSGSIGTFTCTVASSIVVPNAFVTASSRIFIFPTSSTAALRQAGADPLYLSTRTAGTSFTLATAAGGNCAVTDTYDYLVVNPS